MTALDSNVVTVLSSQNVAAKAIARAGLEAANARGGVCVCGAVFAELLGLPGRDPHNLRKMLDSLGIVVEWNFGQTDWETAGQAYQGYVRRRQASEGGLPRTILTDFLIGAHAAVRGYTLFTFDKRLYATAYPRLRVEIL